MGIKYNTNEFIAKAKLVHNDRYDYSLVHYVASRYKVLIICKEHGEFLQAPNHHLNGKKCSKCASEDFGKLFSLNIKNSKQNFSHITPPEGARIIPLTQGRYALVDEEDYEKVNQYNWCCYCGNYVHNRKVGKLHRFIMNVTDPKIKVDHIFHNPLDNRKSQLRVCTHKENIRNSKTQKGTSSKYKGVYWYKDYNKWASEITFNSKKMKLGYFISEEEAAHAYDAKAKELFKEFAYLNFK